MSCESPGSSSKSSSPCSLALTESTLHNHNRRMNHALTPTTATSIPVYRNHDDDDNDSDSTSSGAQLQQSENSNPDLESSDEEPERPDLSYLNWKNDDVDDDDDDNNDNSTEISNVIVPVATTTISTPVTSVVHSTLPSSPRSPSLTRSPSIGTPEHTTMKRGFICPNQRPNRPINISTSGASITSTSTVSSLTKTFTTLSNNNNTVKTNSYHNDSGPLSNRLSNAETFAAPAAQAIRPSPSLSAIAFSAKNQPVASSSSTADSITRNEGTPSLNINHSNTVSGSDFTSPLTPNEYDNHKGKAKQSQGRCQDKDVSKNESRLPEKEKRQPSCSPSPGPSCPIKRPLDNQPPVKKLPRQEGHPAPSLAQAAPCTPHPTPSKPLTPSAPQASKPNDLPPGFDMITFRGKQYVQLNHIKSGGSSRVYKVMGLDRTEYALKDIMIDRFNTTQFDLYIEEVILLKQLQGNDCVIRMYDYEVSRSKCQLRLLFEYGEIDLASYLHHNKLNIYEIRHFWRKMVEATQLLHQRKIVHSDLKPGNFVMVKGRVKIIDFGIAKAINGNTMNIRRNSIYGTPNYMAPEALDDIFSTMPNNNEEDMDDLDLDEEEAKKELYKLGPPADIWALGIILYQMVYGVTPFNKHPNKDAAIRKAPVHYPQKSRLGEEVTPQLLDVMEQCLDKDPKNRPTADRLLRHWFLRS
ncbi:kinase-like domain-containing protein [Zychaea mexicana]|uniref:kinase-like domain-containing protein n=1 Tax=Zychaea mexicana TaxID=64656 RepID=UPI0022FE9178|nr:kinase-like domain-containing protein [Zychaea mexicana]KAI9488703.1 kinase-like domain-containing protein [Zychaea mexicana]